MDVLRDERERSRYIEGKIERVGGRHEERKKRGKEGERDIWVPKIRPEMSSLQKFESEGIKRFSCALSLVLSGVYPGPQMSELSHLLEEG